MTWTLVIALFTINLANEGSWDHVAEIQQIREVYRLSSHAACEDAAKIFEKSDRDRHPNWHSMHACVQNEGIYGTP